MIFDDRSVIIAHLGGFFLLVNMTGQNSFVTIDEVDRVTRKYNKRDQPSGGETTWTNTGTTRSGREMHNSIYFLAIFPFCLSTVSNIMIILSSGAVGYNVIGVFRWIFPKCIFNWFQL